MKVKKKQTSKQPLADRLFLDALTMTLETKGALASSKTEKQALQ